MHPLPKGRSVLDTGMGLESLTDGPHTFELELRDLPFPRRSFKGGARETATKDSRVNVVRVIADHIRDCDSWSYDGRHYGERAGGTSARIARRRDVPFAMGTSSTRSSRSLQAGPGPGDEGDGRIAS